MNVTILPGTAAGTVSAPPSKSCAHRLILCAALAEGESILRGIGQSEDVSATLDCIHALGVSVCTDGQTLRISGGCCSVNRTPVFPCRESGSTLRFLLPLALALGESAVFTGSERLFSRGLSVYETLFAGKAVSFEKTPVSFTVQGKLSAGKYTIPGDQSSQYATGLLFTLPLLSGDSTLTLLPPVESRPYIDLTLSILRQAGIMIREQRENCFFIPGNQKYHALDAQAEGDWSNAAPLLALKAFGAQVQVTWLNPDSTQGDRVFPYLLQKLEQPDAVIDVSNCPDLAPVLFSVAAAKQGAVFIGTHRLRLKESDRMAAMAEELQKFGICTSIEENCFTVFPGTLHAPKTVLSSHNDHRIVMALSLLCTLTGGSISDVEAIRKSYPDFFDDLRSLGISVSET